MANFTEKAIRESFLSLLNERPLNKISVKDITDRCGVNRNTFYYHYQDIPSLIQEIFNSQTRQIIENYDNIDSLEAAVEVSISQLLENKKAISHIYNSANRELFEQYFFQVCGHTVNAFMKTACADLDIADSDMEIISEYYQNSIFGAAMGWLQRGMQDDISRKFKRLFELKKGFADEMISRCEKKNDTL